MKRIYVCGPMSGIPNHNFPEFRRAAIRCRDAGHYALNPADLNCPGTPWIECLEKDIRLILLEKIDTIALLPNWHRSRGGRLEFYICAQLGLDLISALDLKPFSSKLNLWVLWCIGSGLYFGELLFKRIFGRRKDIVSATESKRSPV